MTISNNLIRSIGKLIVPSKLREKRALWLQTRIPRTKRKVKRVLKRIKRHNHAKIGFIASSMGMWKYNHLYKLLNDDSRFEVIALIMPFGGYAEEAKEKEIQQLSAHFEINNIDYKIVKSPSDFLQIKKEKGIDLLFYPQPYFGMYGLGCNWHDNTDCLICYVPYYLGLSEWWWTCDLPFHNVCWKQFMPTEIHKREIAKVARNKGNNILVVGDLRKDDFRTPSHSDPWRKINDGNERKRLIWAPHFQLSKDAVFSRPAFEWTSDVMLHLAKKYRNKLQIAFKPHPRLRSELYKNPEWGKEKTDNYYKEWETMSNTQIEQGDYTDLFIHSDALIHNCGSFTGEYLYVDKPVAFTSKNIDEVLESMHEFGMKCMEAHTIVSNEQQIEDFVEKVVLEGEDPLKDIRKKMIKDFMNPNGTKPSSQRMFESLIHSLELS